MKLTLKKIPFTQSPYSFQLVHEDDIELFSKMGEMLEVEAKSIRDINTHKKYFAMLNLAFNNQSIYEDRNHFRANMQIEAGYFTPLIIGGVEVARWPKSINFASLKEEDFKALCQKVRAVIIRTFNFGIEFDSELAKMNF